MGLQIAWFLFITCAHDLPAGVSDFAGVLVGVCEPPGSSVIVLAL